MSLRIECSNMEIVGESQYDHGKITATNTDICDPNHNIRDEQSGIDVNSMLSV